MKRALSLLLAVVLMLTVSIPAFATETTNQIEAAGGSQSTTVTGTYVAGTAGGTVFSVTIEWAGMDFTYNGASQKQWDPENLVYTGEETAEGWAASNASITVTNRSNANITAAPSFTAASSYSVGMDFSCVYPDEITGLPIASAAPADSSGTGEAKSDTITVTPTGSLPDTTAANTEIGAITVTVSELDTIDQATYSVTYDCVNIAHTLLQTEYSVYDSEEAAANEGATEYIISSEYSAFFDKIYALSKSELPEVTDYTAYYIELIQLYNELPALIHRTA